MAIWRAIRCGSLARALFIAASCTATPAIACPTMTVEALADHLPDARRFAVERALLAPLLRLWGKHRGEALPASADSVAVFAATGQPLVLAYSSGTCLLGLLPTQRDELWRTLREQIGPIA
jgi:hypothetical protein